MSTVRTVSEGDISINSDNNQVIDVVDSNVNIESAEERPGVGYEIFGVGIGIGK